MAERDRFYLPHFSKKINMVVQQQSIATDRDASLLQETSPGG